MIAPFAGIACSARLRSSTPSDGGEVIRQAARVGEARDTSALAFCRDPRRCRSRTLSRAPGGA